MNERVRTVRRVKLGFVTAGTLACLGMGVSTARAATFTLNISPTTISFPNANPSTTPSITANLTVLVSVTITGSGSSGTTPWSVNALASGDLVSGGNSVPVSNITWTSTLTSPCANSCTCLAGTMSRSTPQPVVSGAGDTKGAMSCTQTYRLANQWTYNTGSYSQVITFTGTMP